MKCRCLSCILWSIYDKNEHEEDEHNKLHRLVACKQVKISTIRQLLKTENPNARDARYNTPLHLAARIEENSEVVVELINAGAELNCYNKFEDTPLHVAVTKCNIRATEVLLQSGANVNSRNIDGNTPLHVAVKNSYLRAIEVLLHSCANVNSRNKDGNTPLHLANWSSLNYKGIVEQLIQAGADVNITNNYNETPLFPAVQEGNLDVVNELLKFGADPFERDVRNNTLLHLAAENKTSAEIVVELINVGVEVHSCNSHGSTPLHVAVGHCNIRAIEVFLQSGANVNSKNLSGNTPLHLTNGYSFKYMRIVDMLIQAGADVNITNNNNETPLFRAVQSDNLDVVKELLKFGADPNIRKSDYNSCLHIALLDDSDKYILEELVKNGANINIKDKCSRTALDLAILRYSGGRNGFKDAMVLIRMGVLVDLEVSIDLRQADKEFAFKLLHGFYQVCYSLVRTMTLVRITEAISLHDFALRGMNCTVFSSNIMADHICSKVLLNLLKVNFYPYNNILKNNLPKLYLKKVIMNMGIVSNNGNNQREIELSSDVVWLLCDYLNVTNMFSFIKAFYIFRH